MKSQSWKLAGGLGLWAGLVGFSAMALSWGPLGVGQPGLFNLALTPEALSILLAGLLAILFDWFPGLAAWFDGLSRLKKTAGHAGVVGPGGGGCLCGFVSGLV